MLKLTSLLAFSLIATTSFALDKRELKMELSELNQIVDQTNFIVQKGCSGTLIDLKNKLVLTNYHCIDSNVSVIDKEAISSNGQVKKFRAKKYADVSLEQNGYIGFDKVSSAQYFAEIVAEDKTVDLAIVKIKSDIPHKIASSILPESVVVVRGETVYAVGNPGGMDATIVKGIVSSLNRTFEFPWTDNTKLQMIQFSGGIYGGNSGGSLYNDRGYLIGVPAAGFAQANFIGLAIPAEVVRKFMKRNCLAEAFDTDANNGKCVEDKKKEDKDKDKYSEK
tara:strand:- start:1803 stop:2639 length:837 start_codon:yes stop_codon:yes gene_type:complete